MKTPHNAFKGLAMAAMVAAGIASTAYADDNSMSIWTGDSYRAFNGGANFPYGNPTIDRAPSQFRATNPQGLSNADYAALSEEDPMWQPPKRADPVAQGEAAADLHAWHQQNPHGLTDREYEALSANSPVWQLPDASAPQPSFSIARMRDSFARLFGRSSVN